ncbi:AraC family transcriptional regulator [uncultured Desulfobacter sp.]|uniref:helix-turn-helix transcriptional regulator n=1 Tax=uncultured Desulfobacter sp. TaxID=240139 RepID=UPI0029F537E1|nr:AraC family transcriptional regulator [uncultured Desulfobacter sp.]
MKELTCIKSNSYSRSVGVGFCLDGYFESQSGCCKGPVFCKPNQSGFFYCPELTDVKMTIGAGPFKYAVIVMEMETMLGLVQDDRQRSLPSMKKLEKRDPFLVSDVLTPAMRMVFQQILNCPFTGSARQLFVEGKLMELLAYKLDQLHSGKAPIRQALKLHPADVERVMHAADLLISDLENPPDITELACSVGLSRSTLYRLFNKIYGISPFGYLRDHRLKTAMKLLRSGRVNVTEAAFFVGYANLSHFAKAFKSMFGLTPGESLNQSHSRRIQLT